MGALSWVRLARRVPGVVRQHELANLEALIDAEEGRQPASTWFILACAVPGVIGSIGFLSVFGAWVAGNRGLPLILGTALTATLATTAWFIFYRLFRAIPPSKRRLRDLILKFGRQYAGFGNIVLGEKAISEEFGTLLDEAAGVYLRYCSAAGSTDVPAKAEKAIEDAMSKLMEVAVKDQAAQSLALAWARPTLDELRLLNQSLTEHSMKAELTDLADPLAGLREARAEIDTSNQAAQELDQHLRTH